jgi:hypothetical protein
MSIYDQPQGVYAISKATRISMDRIRFLVSRYGIEAAGEDDRGETYHLQDIRDALKEDERRVEQARADWARRHPAPRY